MTSKKIKLTAIILLLAAILTFTSCATAASNNQKDSETKAAQSNESETNKETQKNDETQAEESSTEVETQKESESSSSDAAPIRHTVTFDLNFENSQNPKTQSVSAGEKAIIPSIPLRDGFIFSGWYLDKSYSSLFDFSESINSDITLYALWHGEEYLINSDKKRSELARITELNGGTLPQISLNENGSVSFILGKFSSKRVTDFDSALSALLDVKTLIGVEDITHEFTYEGRRQTQKGYSFVLSQIFGSYKVYGKQIIINADKAGNVIALSSNYSPKTPKFKPSVNITKKDAADVFTKSGFGIPSAHDGARIIFRGEEHDEHAYIFDKGATTVIVSAYDGQVIESFSNLMFALPKSPAKVTQAIGREQSTSTETFPTALYEFLESKEKTFLMHDTVRNIVYHDLREKTVDTSLPLWEYEYYNTPPLCDSDNVWNSPEGMEASELCLAICDAYDFYFELFGKDFFDGQILVFINDGSIQSKNAFCSPIFDFDGKDTVIISFAPGKISFETAAHELSHVVHEKLVKSLFKSGESGAIAEAYSCVMSKLISQNKNGYADWSDVKYGTDEPLFDDIHEKSVIISRALYKICNGINDTKTSAELLYNAWGYMRNNADLNSFRMALLASAQELGLDLSKIEKSFFEVGVSPNMLTQSTLGKLTLSVIDTESEKPIQNAKISIKTLNSLEVIQISANSDGIAPIMLDFGTYVIGIEAEEYEVESVVCAIIPEKETLLQIEIKPLFRKS